jgi:hypothetical protein
MKIALFWALKQRIVVIPYRRFGTTYRSHLQCSGIQGRDSRLLKGGPTGFPETSVRNYHYSLPNRPENRSSLLIVIYILRDPYVRFKG